jgi:hypothetical protein
MSDQAPISPPLDVPVADPPRNAFQRAWWWRLDAACRLGARPVALFLLHRARLAAGLPQRALADAPPASGRFLPAAAPPAPPLPPGAAARLLAAAAALPARPDWHGGFDAAAPALALDIFAAGDIRPVWEASRFGDLLLLVQAARIAPEAGHLGRAEALLAAWAAANPSFRGPAWACGQEAALRALSLALALALLAADHDPPPGARALLRLCARRIAATPAYAAAQDNNHAISEPAGAFACALLLGEAAAARRAAARLAAAVARLVAPDGGFAQVSAGYARLALDVLSVAEWLRRRHGAPPFPAPLPARAAALAGWLQGLLAADGTTPRLGMEDGSAFADLGLRGPADAAGSLERALRLFADAGDGDPADASDGDPADAGAAWLGLAAPARRLAPPARWRVAGSMGWAEAGASAVLRTGPLRFRPAQSDLLHLTLRDGALAVLRDAGTGAYNPPAGWWWAALNSAAAHNAVLFDDAEPMPRAGRFLLARWPAMTALAEGAARRDGDGNRQARRIAVRGRVWTVTDDIAGGFRRARIGWRLPEAAWRLTAEGVEGAPARIAMAADAPILLRLIQGWESPAYGQIAAAPILLAELAAPASRITTRIELP